MVGADDECLFDGRAIHTTLRPKETLPPEYADSTVISSFLNHRYWEDAEELAQQPTFDSSTLGEFQLAQALVRDFSRSPVSKRG